MSLTALGATGNAPPASRRHGDLGGAALPFPKTRLHSDVVTSRFEMVAIDPAPGRDTTLVGFRTRLFNDVGQMVLDGEPAYLLRWSGGMATADHGNAA